MSDSYWAKNMIILNSRIIIEPINGTENFAMAAYEGRARSNTTQCRNSKIREKQAILGANGFGISGNGRCRRDPTTFSDVYIAYLPVHSRANFVYFSRSVLYTRAISGTRGSSGFGSVRREQIESKTLLIVNAGDHWDLRMSKHILPFEFMFGW